MIKFLAALVFAAAMVVFAQAADAEVVQLPEHPTMEEQVAAVKTISEMTGNSLEYLRIVHRNCDDTFNVVYYEAASTKWVFVQETSNLGGPETQEALDAYFGPRDWENQVIGTILTEAPCDGFKQMQMEQEFHEYYYPVEPEQFFPGVDMWIEANPGYDYYFIIAPRCDGEAWAAYGHNAVDEVPDLFITYAKDAQHMYSILDEHWPPRDWDAAGEETYISMPDFCLELPSEISA